MSGPEGFENTVQSTENHIRVLSDELRELLRVTRDASNKRHGHALADALEDIAPQDGYVDEVVARGRLEDVVKELETARTKLEQGKSNRLA